MTPSFSTSSLGVSSLTTDQMLVTRSNVGNTDSPFVSATKPRPGTASVDRYQSISFRPRQLEFINPNPFALWLQNRIDGNHTPAGSL
jgi:hypothetical protein